MGPLSEPEKEQKRLQIRIWRYILGGALGTVSLYYFYKWFLKRRNPLLEAFIEQELRLKGPRSQDISYEQRMQNRQAMEEAYRENSAYPHASRNARRPPRVLLYDAAKAGDAEAVRNAVEQGANVLLGDKGGYLGHSLLS